MIICCHSGSNKSTLLIIVKSSVKSGTKMDAALQVLTEQWNGMESRKIAGQDKMDRNVSNTSADQDTVENDVSSIRADQT